MKIVAGLVLASIAIANTVAADSNETVTSHPPAVEPSALSPATEDNKSPKLASVEELKNADPSDSTESLFDPQSQPKVNASEFAGLGPQTTSVVDPKLERATTQILGTASTPSPNALPVDPRTLPKADPKDLTGLGTQQTSNDPTMMNAVERLATTRKSGKKGLAIKSKHKDSQHVPEPVATSSSHDQNLAIGEGM
ncbi:hypothetical protein PsorP6_001923 [Peronosclerospora sorghi]|uniref:Uncharacterized protein n=1 Tax=Peronosclerospora sorghi TaxID=230839 RepID=A0ACC0WVJ2_9STRA|nr:hypothetical protein PsorP6_001923 [Peronosclerospora sorghi]